MYEVFVRDFLRMDQGEGVHRLTDRISDYSKGKVASAYCKKLFDTVVTFLESRFTEYS